MFAFDMESGEIVTKLVEKCMEKGLITFWFLSNPHSFRLSPPLNITEDQVNEATKLILEALDEISN
jgi:4-aminobutyrate aminotransferase-like enzyme